jgi:mRNA interferase RelE/StbE
MGCGRPKPRAVVHAPAPQAAGRAFKQLVVVGAVGGHTGSGGPLLDNPHRVGKPLRFELDGYYSARRGQYRVIYRIDGHEVIVYVIKISHRAP